MSEKSAESMKAKVLQSAPVLKLSGALRWPKTPWNFNYGNLRNDFIVRSLSSPSLTEAFQNRQQLPKGFGYAFDERVVEYPWLFAQHPAGDVLDAGSVLNHGFIIERAVKMFNSLTIVTLAPERLAFHSLGVSYNYADLRSLPYGDETFNTVISVSTFEHVGMDNTAYAASVNSSNRASDASAELVKAVIEIKRVLVSGGGLLLTVPYGLREDFGWLRQFDRADLDHLIEIFEPSNGSEVVYQYGDLGWQLSDFDCAKDCRYLDPTEHRIGPDGAVAARAVACVKLVK